MGVKIVLTNGNEHFIPDVAEVTDKVVEELAKLNIENMMADSLVENRTVISSIVENDCFSTGSSNSFETAVMNIVNDNVLYSSNETLQDAVRSIADEFCFSTTDDSSVFETAVEGIVNNLESALISDLTNNRTSNKADVYIPNITVLTDEALPAIGKTGDYCIIKDTETDTQTAYMYVEDHWEALNGNYNATNVYFADDIEITKEIGYITLDETGAGKIPAKDKNLVEVFGEMFAQDKDPIVSQPKINSFTLSNAGKSFEVGTELTNLSFEASFYAGNYQYGPATDISPSWEIKQGNTVISQEASGTIDKLVIMDDTNYVLKAIANYGQGAIPFTFKQKEKAELRIAEGSVDTTTSAITGYRSYYYGPIYSKIEDPTTALTSELIKGLLKKSTNNCNNKTTITWKAADYEDIVGYIIAVPSNNNTVINKVSLVSNSNQDITDTYKPYVTSENIRGIGEDAGVLYSVWLYQPNSLGTDEEHSITFKNK